ncbi:hypothetical protein DPEC_G00326350 [Dallia pectoralis]|uniref:Uncharacterized protein n=1 Tax=Dallia pectoralis TaxID=75939 RepID=A0ACC2F817_DALPE|nr:hypothetical protein DPEC_G00326350 [Dallia pectoralis]
MHTRVVPTVYSRTAYRSQEKLPPCPRLLLLLCARGVVAQPLLKCQAVQRHPETVTVAYTRTHTRTHGTHAHSSQPRTRGLTQAATAPPPTVALHNLFSPPPNRLRSQATEHSHFSPNPHQSMPCLFLSTFTVFRTGGGPVHSSPYYLRHLGRGVRGGGGDPCTLRYHSLGITHGARARPPPPCSPGTDL